MEEQQCHDATISEQEYGQHSEVEMLNPDHDDIEASTVNNIEDESASNPPNGNEIYDIDSSSIDMLSRSVQEEDKGSILSNQHLSTSDMVEKQNVTKSSQIHSETSSAIMPESKDPIASDLSLKGMDDDTVESNQNVQYATVSDDLNIAKQTEKANRAPLEEVIESQQNHKSEHMNNINDTNVEECNDLKQPPFTVDGSPDRKVMDMNIHDIKVQEENKLTPIQNSVTIHKNDPMLLQMSESMILPKGYKVQSLEPSTNPKEEMNSTTSNVTPVNTKSSVDQAPQESYQINSTPNKIDSAITEPTRLSNLTLEYEAVSEEVINNINETVEDEIPKFTSLTNTIQNVEHESRLIELQSTGSYSSFTNHTNITASIESPTERQNSNVATPIRSIRNHSNLRSSVNIRSSREDRRIISTPLRNSTTGIQRTGVSKTLKESRKTVKPEVQFTPSVEDLEKSKSITVNIEVKEIILSSNVEEPYFATLSRVYNTTPSTLFVASSASSDESKATLQHHFSNTSEEFKTDLVTGNQLYFKKKDFEFDVLLIQINGKEVLFPGAIVLKLWRVQHNTPELVASGKVRFEQLEELWKNQRNKKIQINIVEENGEHIFATSIVDCSIPLQPSIKKQSISNIAVQKQIETQVQTPVSGNMNSISRVDSHLDQISPPSHITSTPNFKKSEISNEINTSSTSETKSAPQSIKKGSSLTYEDLERIIKSNRATIDKLLSENSTKDLQIAKLQSDVLQHAKMREEQEEGILCLRERLEDYRLKEVHQSLDNSETYSLLEEEATTWKKRYNQLRKEYLKLKKDYKHREELISKLSASEKGLRKYKQICITQEQVIEKLEKVIRELHLSRGPPVAKGKSRVNSISQTLSHKVLEDASKIPARLDNEDIEKPFSRKLPPISDDQLSSPWQHINPDSDEEKIVPTTEDEINEIPDQQEKTTYTRKQDSLIQPLSPSQGAVQGVRRFSEPHQLHYNSNSGKNALKRQYQHPLPPKEQLPRITRDHITQTLKSPSEMNLAHFNRLLSETGALMTRRRDKNRILASTNTNRLQSRLRNERILNQAKGTDSSGGALAQASKSLPNVRLQHPNQYELDGEKDEQLHPIDLERQRLENENQELRARADFMENFLEDQIRKYSKEMAELKESLFHRQAVEQ